MAKIIYTYTDEAPMLATYSLLPVFQRFARPMGITIEKKDISVAGRILSYFPDFLTTEQVCNYVRSFTFYNNLFTSLETK